MKMDDLGVWEYPYFWRATHIFGNLAIFEAENLEEGGGEKGCQYSPLCSIYKPHASQTVNLRRIS